MLNTNKQSQNLYSTPNTQELLTLDHLFEEISDDKSASITGGARGDFAGIVPSRGSATFPEEYTTTSQFNDISIRAYVPYPTYVKAVRADGKGDVSSYARRIPPRSNGLITVAAGVKDGTRFKLNFSASTARNSFNISGPITY